MADDVTFQTTVATPPSGTKVATDDVGGVHYQKVKLDLGADGASSPVSSTVPVSGTVTVNALPAGTNNIGDVDVVTLPALPAGTNAIGKLAANDGVDIGDVTLNNTSVAVTGADGSVFVRSNAASTFPINVGRINGNVTASGSGTIDTGTQRVVLATDQPVVTTKLASATATLSNVNDTNVSTTLLASNSSRLGATIWNDSTAILYVKFGTTASATSCTVKMVADAYYEVPSGYTGRIDGIWASDASGAARITELT